MNKCRKGHRACNAYHIHNNKDGLLAILTEQDIFSKRKFIIQHLMGFKELRCMADTSKL